MVSLEATAEAARRQAVGVGSGGADDYWDGEARAVRALDGRSLSVADVDKNIPRSKHVDVVGRQAGEDGGPVVRNGAVTGRLTA